jgi:tetratricopeptide (TPR) repeat protein
VSPIALIALFGWVPFVITLFAILPARRAMVISSIGAWLLLPPAGIDLPGFPTYDKAAAATIGILLATAIFEPSRLATFRFRWFDLPMLCWWVCPLFSSISNNLGLYDGFSCLFRGAVSWLFPYMVGRLYLTDPEGLRDLALGMIIGGVCLVPLCLFETRASPLLLPIVYSLDRWEGTRFAGYRPRVFFSTGLELGLWMNAVVLVATWLWRTGQLKRLGNVPGGLITAMLWITAILCRSTGATVLLVSGLGTLWTCWRTKTKWVMCALLAAAPVYYALRIQDIWTGERAVELARSLVGQDRANSLEYRLLNEDVFIAKALQRPIFGWGGWGRIFVYDDAGNKLTVSDQLTVIAFASYGFVGLTAFLMVWLLPPALFLRRFTVKQWTRADVAPAAVIALVVNLYLLDCMVNGMLNTIYIIAAGGLLTVMGNRPKLQLANHNDTNTGRGNDERSRLLDAEAVPEPSFYHKNIGMNLATVLSEPQENLALQYQALARDLRTQRQYAQAKAIWLHAFELWTELTAARPDCSLLHQRWCDCANDFAWLLTNAPDPSIRDCTGAVALADKAARANPNCATYWNTLGAAHYRAGNFNAAIASLKRAIDLTQGGTAFDQLFLAMAYAQLGNERQARHWLDHARLWMEQHNPDHPELARLRDEACSALPVAADSSIAVP